METNYNILYLSLLKFYVGYKNLKLKDVYKRGLLSKPKYYKILKEEVIMTRADYLVLFIKLLDEARTMKEETLYDNLNTYFKV